MMTAMRDTARIALVALMISSLGGCFLWPFESTPPCEKRQEYKTARSSPTLSVPEDLDTPSSSARLEIPTVGSDAPIWQSGDPCLEEPPDYGGVE